MKKLFRRWLPTHQANPRFHNKSRLAVMQLEDRVVPNAAPIALNSTVNVHMATQGSVVLTPDMSDPDGDPLEINFEK